MGILPSRNIRTFSIPLTKADLMNKTELVSDNFSFWTDLPTKSPLLVFLNSDCTSESPQKVLKKCRFFKRSLAPLHMN